MDAVSGAIRVLRGKGGRSRSVGIDPGGIEHVNRWLLVRAMLPFVTPLSPLFCTRTGGVITTARYLDHINPQAVIQAMGKRAW